MAITEKLEKVNKEAGLRCSGALSKLLHTEVGIEFFSPLITDIKKIPSFISSPKIGSGILLPITEVPGTRGAGLLFFPEETSFNICDIMMKRPLGETRKLSEFDQGVIKETGNILLGNYLAILSNTLKREMIGSVPRFSFGLFGAILQDVITNFAKDTLEALVIKIIFNILPAKMEGYLFLLFRPNELKELLKDV